MTIQCAEVCEDISGSERAKKIFHAHQSLH